MIELGKAKRQAIQSICQDSEEVLVRGAMEGTMGRVFVPKLQNSSYCLIHAGDFDYLLGLPPSGGEGALNLKSLIYEICSGDFITPGDERWAAWLEEEFQGQYRTVTRYALKKDENHFDRAALEGYKKNIPEGIRIRKIDERLYQLTLKEEWSRDFCVNFEDAAQFMRDGLGFVAMKGREIVAGCSAYGYSSGMMEVEVGTRKDYRRQGLALACSAAFLLECLDRGIYPNWDAANEQSVGLAEKLGYVFHREYQVYQLLDTESEE